MKSDKLLKQFQQKGLKAKMSNASTFNTLKDRKNFRPIDSGQLFSIKGGGSEGDPPPLDQAVKTN